MCVLALKPFYLIINLFYAVISRKSFFFEEIILPPYCLEEPIGSLYIVACIFDVYNEDPFIIV